MLYFCGFNNAAMLPQESKEAIFLDLLKLPKRNFDLISMPSGLRQKGSNFKTNYMQRYNNEINCWNRVAISASTIRKSGLFEFDITYKVYVNLCNQQTNHRSITAHVLCKMFFFLLRNRETVKQSVLTANKYRNESELYWNDAHKSPAFEGIKLTAAKNTI